LVTGCLNGDDDKRLSHSHGRTLWSHARRNPNAGKAGAYSQEWWAPAGALSPQQVTRPARKKRFDLVARPTTRRGDWEWPLRRL